MKNFLRIFIVSVMMLCNPLKALTPQMPGAGKGGLLPMPSQAEMEEINKFLSTLSEKELEELAKIGEEIMMTAEQEGIPLFDDTALKQEVAKPASAPKPQKVEPKKPKKAPKPTPKNETQAIRAILTNLIKSIDSIRQKASSDHELEDMLAPLDSNLNTLLYYLYVVNEDKLAGSLKEPQYQQTYNMIKLLNVNLENLDDRFDVPEQLSMKKKVNTDRIKKAHKVLQEIIQLFKRAFMQQNLNQELEKILKKYEPEALKIKKELEAKEKQATDSLKKLPLPNAGKPMPIPRAYPGAFGGQPHTVRPTPGNSAAPLPGRSPAGMTHNKPVPATPPANAQTKKEQPKTKQKPKATLADIENGIGDQLSKIESSLASNYSDIKNYLTGYTPQKRQSDVVNNTLTETNFSLKKLKTTVNEWYKHIDKNSENSQEFINKTKKMKDLYTSQKHENLKNLHAKTKTLVNGRVTLDGSVKRFYELMSDIEKKLSGVI